MTILAGEGGNGKSSLSLHLAARVSTGQPALGLAYEAGPAGEALLVSCEDDLAQTTVPEICLAQSPTRRITGGSVDPPPAGPVSSVDAGDGAAGRFVRPGLGRRIAPGARLISTVSITPAWMRPSTVSMNTSIASGEGASTARNGSNG